MERIYDALPLLHRTNYIIDSCQLEKIIDSSNMTPEFWIELWPAWKASILTCAAILVFRIFYRSFILHLTEHLKERYHYDFIDDFFKAFNHPIQTYLWILAFYMFIVLSPADPFSHHPIFDRILRSSLVICLIWVLESGRFLAHTATKLVLYDRIELIVPERRAELVADLEKRLGLKIDKLEIGHVDFLKDAAFIKVHYTPDADQDASSVDQLTRFRDFVE